jgi:hypothetical protein
MTKIGDPTLTLAPAHIESQVQPMPAFVPASPLAVDKLDSKAPIQSVTEIAFPTILPSAPIFDAKHEVLDWQDATQEPNARTALFVQSGLIEIGADPTPDLVALQKQIREVINKGRPSVFIEDPNSLFYELDKIRHVLRNGGTIVIALDTFQNAQELVTLNGLFAHPPEIFGEIATPNQDIRVVGLLSEQYRQAPCLTSDFRSRFSRCENVDAKSIQRSPSPKESNAKPAFIPLAGSPRWRELLDQGWQKAAAMGADRIVIRHPPEKPFRQAFNRHLLVLKTENPNIFIEIQELTPAKDKVDQKPSEPSKQVIVVNQANFHRLFCSSFGSDGLSDTKIQPLPPILDYFGEEGRSLPQLLLDGLTETQIDFIRSDPRVWPVKVVEADSSRTAPNDDDKHAKVIRKTVSNIDDATKEALQHNPEAIVIDLRSPVYCSGDLLEAITSDPPQVKKGPLFEELRKGQTIILRGLEDRPDLKQRLAGLLCDTPHILLGGHLHFLRALPGRIILLDSSEPEIVVPLDTKSMSTVCNKEVIDTNRAVFLTGPPGSGKSHTMQQLAKEAISFNPGSIGKRHTEEFLKTILAWAKTKPIGNKPILLTIDEANLAEKHFWQMFAGFFAAHPPQITVLGETIKLKENHRIIFTGNDDSMTGRTVDPMIRKHFHFVRFEEMSVEHLRVRILEPYGKELKLPPKIIDTLLPIHLHFAQHYPHQPATVRSLKNVLIRVALDVEKGIDLQQSLWQNSLEIYGGNLSGWQKRNFETWLRLRLGDVADIESTFKLADNKEIVAVLSAEQFAQQIDRELDIRDSRTKSSNPVVQAANRAVIVEGPPARGKDVLTQQVLKQRGLRHATTIADVKEGEGAKYYYTVTAGIGFSALRTIIDKARKDGSIVVVSELNLLPAEVLEGELNDLITGDGAEPGFLLIGTINPPSYEGREPLSAAFRNRTRYIELQDYSADEQQTFLEARGVSKEEAAKVVKNHEKIKNAQLALGSRGRIPTTRQLESVAQQLKKKEELRKVLESAYGFFSSESREAHELPDYTQEMLLGWGKVLWSENQFQKIVILKADDPRQPLLLEHEVWLKEPTSGTRQEREAALRLQMTAAIAGKRFPSLSAQKCCERLARTEQITLDIDRIKHLARLFITGEIVSGESSVLVSQLEVRQQGPQFRRATISRSGLFTEPVAKDAPAIGTWKQQDVTQIYLASGHFVIDGKALPDEQNTLLVEAPKQWGSPPQRQLPDKSLHVTLDSKQLSHVSRLFLPARHVPWVTATIIDKSGEKRELRQWGLPKLDPGEHFLAISYDAFHIAGKVSLSPLSARQELDEKLIPSDLKALLVDKKGSPAQIQKIADWIRINTVYCTTTEQREQARIVYNRKYPTPNDFLTHRRGVCQEGADLLGALIAQNFPGLPVRLVSGRVGSRDGNISAEAHAWIEVLHNDKWVVYDATPLAASTQATASVPGEWPAWPIPQLNAALKQTIAREIARRLSQPEFHYPSLQTSLVASSSASRQTNEVSFSKDKPIYAVSELGVSEKRAPIVLAFPDGDPVLWQAQFDPIGRFIIQQMLSEGFKFQVLGNDGELQTVYRADDILEWGQNKTDRTPTAFAKAKECAASNTLVLSTTELFVKAIGISLTNTLLAEVSLKAWKPSREQLSSLDPSGQSLTQYVVHATSVLNDSKINYPFASWKFPGAQLREPVRDDKLGRTAAMCLWDTLENPRRPTVVLGWLQGQSMMLRMRNSNDAKGKNLLSKEDWLTPDNLGNSLLTRLLVFGHSMQRDIGISDLLQGISMTVPEVLSDHIVDKVLDAIQPNKKILSLFYLPKKYDPNIAAAILRSLARKPRSSDLIKQLLPFLGTLVKSQKDLSIAAESENLLILLKNLQRSISPDLIGKYEGLVKKWQELP